MEKKRKGKKRMEKERKGQGKIKELVCYSPCALFSTIIKLMKFLPYFLNSEKLHDLFLY